MAVTLLRVLVLGVIAAAADDLPVTWAPARTLLPCVVPDGETLVVRGPPLLLDSDDQNRLKPYVWIKDNEEIKQSLTNVTLEVLQKKDGTSEGVYQCGVRHHGLVLGYPIILKFAFIEKYVSVVPENSTVRAGQPFVLTCNISSGPSASITWLKGEEVISENDRYYYIDNKHQLLILNAKEQDAGVYWCKATNPVLNKSRNSSPALVQVEREEGQTGLAFLPLQQDTTIYVSKGSRVVLPCPVVGWPKPEIVWKLTPSIGRTAEQETIDQVLVLPSMQADLEGVFSCSVDGNNDLVKTYNVTITEPVNITLPPASKQVYRASTVRFNCTATGKPAPIITWYKDGKPLVLAGRKVVLTSFEGNRRELLIRSVTSDDAGVYQCFARNALQERGAWARLEVAGAGAEAPRGVRCAAAGPARVRVYWDLMDADVVAYTVQRSVSQGTMYPGVPRTTNEEIITVNEPLTPYKFQVTAYILTKNNKTIASDPSETVTCQGQGVPIKITRVNDERVVVSWHQFAEEHPGVLQWTLQYRTEDDNQIQNVTFDGSVHQYIFQALPGTELRVLGWKVLGIPENLSDVPWQRADLDRVPDGYVTAVPTNVRVTSLGSRDMIVTWRCDEAESSLDVYTFLVCVKDMEGNEDCIESKSNTATVDNLEPNSEYEVRVQARLPGQLVGGAFSDPVDISTQSEGIERFQDLNHKYINSTTIRVSWSSGSEKKFLVQYSNDLELPVDQWASVETSGNTILLTGLNLTKELHVMVTGYEPEGFREITTIPSEVPVVEDLHYTVGERGVTVQWRGRGPRVLRYTQNLTHSLDSWVELTVPHNSVTLTDLDPNVETYLVVAAPGTDQKSKVVTIPPHPSDYSTLYLGLGIVGGVLLLLVLAVAAICIWRHRKRFLTPDRSRRRNVSTTDGQGESCELQDRAVRERLANGVKDAGEPLLNGTVHITENPSSKRPNGRARRGERRYEVAFDLSRHEESAAPPPDPPPPTHTPYDLSRGYNKLPDDNMNELPRPAPSSPEDTKVQPTLQPNG